jgi:Tfp pilus assembly protein PilF
MSGDDDDTPAPKRPSRRKLPPVPRQTPDEREAEDVKVAAFYQNDGDYKGAYMRGLDAVSLDDSDPSAHLALAEAARKLGKLDEAQKHYKRCLELDPVNKDRKVAERALKEMAGGGA